MDDTFISLLPAFVALFIEHSSGLETKERDREGENVHDIRFHSKVCAGDFLINEPPTVH